ncbi:MAG TPA: cytidine deaminase [Gemmatales bacterium]|nr:cytidine deaminase [Gemmatales bacterium]HMP61485.1 cytidine deaminase [Gemmatales bacterium]
METHDVERLLAAARQARKRARCTYSGFAVGAALWAADGTISTGCNIENASYGLTVCAERVALWKALSDGHHRFTAIAIVADTPAPTPPCGPCRQLLWEFAGDLAVYLGNLASLQRTFTLAELFPHPFDDRQLRTGPPATLGT